MANWTSFQSVIQLAIALNCAFATLAPFLGSVSERDRLLAAAYAQQMDNYEADLDRAAAAGSGNPQLVERVASVQRILDGFKHASVTTDQRIVEFLNGKIRLVCLFAAALSLGALFYSSYPGQADELGLLPHVYMYLQYAPFVGGVGWIMWLAGRHLINRRGLYGLTSEIQSIEIAMKPYKKPKKERPGTNGTVRCMPGMSGAIQEPQTGG